MRDPRNWVRPAVAVVAGTAAGGALVLLRARRRAQQSRRPRRRSLVGARSLRTAGASRRVARRRAGCSAIAERRAWRRTPAVAVGSLPRMATCYRHPSRETGVSCSSCGRPICPDCMTPTPVGMRCPECSRQRTKVKRMRDIATVPRVTYALIAINVIAFFTEQGQFTISGSTIHGTVINEGVLYRAGIAEGQYWRLVSSAFLHENLLHIGFNMYLLYLLGMMLEPAIGSLRFAVDLLHLDAHRRLRRRVRHRRRPASGPPARSSG